MLAGVAAALLCWPCGVDAAGAKLWQLGELVESNPIITFSMFVFSVALTIAIETAKHNAEHSTRDFWRKKALTAIWSELMILGVVAFALIVSAETGLQDVRITLGCDANPPPPIETDLAPGESSASSSASSSSSGPSVSSGSSSSGSDECGIGFDLLIFEYAHMVLFFMGISYALFMQMAFMNRNHMFKTIRRAQKAKPLAGWLEGAAGRSAPTWAAIVMKGQQWGRISMTFRAAMCVHLSEPLKEACSVSQTRLEQALAAVRGDATPNPAPHPAEAARHFDMSRFTKAAMSIELLELLAISKGVWCSVPVIAFVTLFLPKYSALTLSSTMIVAAALGPLLACGLIIHLARTVASIAARAQTHSMLTRMDFYLAKTTELGHFSMASVGEREDREALSWAEGGPCPWSILKGREHDPRTIHLILQLILIGTCFYTGELVMLSPLIADERGGAVLLALWFLPLVTLFFLLPRALFLFAVVASSSSPSRELLRYACGGQWHDKDAHTHGHHAKEHDHGGIGCALCNADRSSHLDEEPIESGGTGLSAGHPDWVKALAGLSSGVTRGETDASIAKLARKVFASGAAARADTLAMSISVASSARRSPQRNPLVVIDKPEPPRRPSEAMTEPGSPRAHEYSPFGSPTAEGRQRRRSSAGRGRRRSAPGVAARSPRRSSLTPSSRPGSRGMSFDAETGTPLLVSNADLLLADHPDIMTDRLC
eukprot:TRINITY_DN16985_c0_g1_i1.p1 TRINITY_DN16985_c0_g1~~TRINITY_DN16985_c0_g1_i1.p1  ORF type:complete len:747 (+),score=189.95 TRINITY_DN16985_c0_g1_i1:99-2243(+)